GLLDRAASDRLPRQPLRRVALAYGGRRAARASRRHRGGVPHTGPGAGSGGRSPGAILTLPFRPARPRVPPCTAARSAPNQSLPESAPCKEFANTLGHGVPV